MWNALFVKDVSTVTALTSTTLNGKRGIWAVDGRVIRGEARVPAGRAVKR
jgi:hypothetical protein